MARIRDKLLEAVLNICYSTQSTCVLGSILEIASIITKNLSLSPVERIAKFVETLSFNDSQMAELERDTKVNRCQQYGGNSLKAD